MTGQYGEPDWANAAGSSTPVVDTATSGTTTGNWASSGEDFSGATANANVAGLSNASSA